MTEGMKSSEFWLTLIFTVLAIVCKILLGDKCPISSEAIAIPIATYSLARGIRKRG